MESSETGTEGVARLSELFAACRTAGISADRIQLDPAIARGLDYYTGTIFETFLDDLPVEKRCPFSVVHFHATVQDAKGRRMSKSAGNGIDPLDMIEKYGADAVRYSLVSLTREGQDVRLSEDRFEEGRRFSNKVWNATRFVCMNLEGERSDGTLASAATLEDRWILSRLAAVRTEREVLHELGHLAGLHHCDAYDCLMYFASSVHAIDNRGSSFCRDCGERLPSGLLPRRAMRD